MRRRRRARPSTPAFEGINITPFTDVLLVLLIIFMIAGSSLAPTGLGLTALAQAGDPPSASESPPSLSVMIGPDGTAKLLLGDEETSWERLRDLPAATRVTLSIDSATAAEQAIKHYDRLLSAGLKEIEWGPPSQGSR